MYTYGLLRTKRGYVSKRIDVDSLGNMAKSAKSAAISNGQVVVATNETFEQAVMSLAAKEAHTAAIHGVPKQRPIPLALNGSCVTEEQWKTAINIKCKAVTAISADAIARSKSDFEYVEGPALLMLDADAIKADRVPANYVCPEYNSCSAKELYDLIIKAEPALAKAPAVIVSGSSAWWFDTKQNKYISQGGSQRCYFGINHGTKIPVLVDNIFNRLAALGHAHLEVGKSGRFLNRGPIDKATSGCERIDFCFTAVPAKKQLEKRAPASSSWAINLTEPPADVSGIEFDELAKAQAKVTFLRLQEDASFIALADERYAAWEAQRVEEFSHNNPKATDEESTNFVQGLVATRKTDKPIRLPKDFILSINANTKISVADFLLDYNKYQGKYILDPLEPDYGDYAELAWVAIQKTGKARCIFSHAHGGTLFLLEDTPTPPSISKFIDRLTCAQVIGAMHEIDEQIFFPKTNDQGNPLATEENLWLVCRHHKIWIEYDKLERKTNIVYNASHQVDFDEHDNNSLTYVVDCCARYQMPTQRVPELIKLIGSKYAHHPVITWVHSVAWDGKDRIIDLLNTIGSPMDLSLKTILVTKWLMYCARCCYNEGLTNADGALGFQSEGGAGKGEWLKRLAPSDTKWIRVGATLKPSDKDSIAQLCGNWISELGEIDSIFTKAEVGEIKSFISNPSDTYRNPYDRRHNRYPRRTALFYSVNDQKYLTDKTGNRKFWTIPVTSLDYHHDIDAQQLWAQVFQLASLKDAKGQWVHPHWLSEEQRKALAVSNEEFELNDVELERLVAHFDWDNQDFNSWRWTTAASIAANDFLIRSPSRRMVSDLGLALNKLGSKSKKVRGVKMRQVPPTRYVININDPHSPEACAAQAKASEVVLNTLLASEPASEPASDQDDDMEVI